MLSVSGPHHRHIASVGGLFPEATSHLAPGRDAYIFGGHALQFGLLHVIILLYFMALSVRRAYLNPRVVWFTETRLCMKYVSAILSPIDEMTSL